MKIIKEQIPTLKRGRLLTVELAPGENLIAVKDDKFYRLGGQVEAVVAGHVLTSGYPVVWCSVSQEWVES